MIGNPILIVDDNPLNIKVLGNLLKNNNYNVEFALNGKSAVDWVLKKDFDLILLDVMMPEMDGFEVGRILKNTPEKRDIPIIFLTAKNDEESVLKGFSSGGSDFLTKPFIQTELLAKVSTHLALKHTRDQLKQQNWIIKEYTHYARLIQEALLPAEKFKTIFPNSFIVFQSGNIASGNFYWIKEVADKTILIAVDCNKRGVPGALMGMLGMSLLNELPLKPGVKANEMLRLLNSKIKDILKQSHPEQKEDIAMALCIIDSNAKQMQFSGALLNLYLIRQNKLKEYNGDHKYLGKGTDEEAFTNYSIDVKQEDRIYLYNNRINKLYDDEKNDAGLFQELLLSIQKIEMRDQGAKMENFINSTTVKYKRMDDIMVIGIEL